MKNASPEKSTPSVVTATQWRPSAKQRSYAVRSNAPTTTCFSSSAVPFPILKLSRNRSKMEFGSVHAAFRVVIITVLLSFIAAFLNVFSNSLFSSFAFFFKTIKLLFFYKIVIAGIVLHFV